MIRPDSYTTLLDATLRRRYCGGGWWPAGDEHVLIDLEKISTTRYRYRGAVIPSPWPDIEEGISTAA
jgi:RNA-directed DNA polymerase